MEEIQYYTENGKIYSPDMMFSYLEIFKHPIKIVDIKPYLPQLKNSSWKDANTGKEFNPLEIINNKKLSKYHWNKINKSNLSYPIITHGSYIVDGRHRLAKAYLKGYKKIKIYNFDNKLLNKFYLGNNFDKISNLKLYEYISLFYKRFT